MTPLSPLNRPGRRSDGRLVGLLSCAVLVIGLYVIGRTAGRWAETDSAEFTNIIRNFVANGRLVPPANAYPNGYAFQAISAFLLAFTGMEVSTLQQMLYPCLTVVVVVPAWLMYRALTGSTAAAAIATGLLFTQPEFLFVVLRSSHEKFSRAMMMLALFALASSFHLLREPRRFAVFVSLFYLFTFTQITSNNLLANSFTVAIAGALLIGIVVNKLRPVPWAGTGLKRLFYSSLLCLCFVYVFTFYVYLPARHDISVLADMSDKVSALFLDTEQEQASEIINPYSYISIGWINLPVYFLVSLANWLMLFSSFVFWLIQGWRWLWRGQIPRSSGIWLLWLLYTSFALQGALSILVDNSGALSSNIQHRLFPSFSIFGVAMVAYALAEWRPVRLRQARTALATVLGCVALLSVFKATNEPVLSNKWTFYRANELAAMRWADANLRNNHVWSEFDERLITAYRTVYGDSPNANVFSGFELYPYTRGILVTDVTRLRATRLKRELPVPSDALRVYDNGEAILFRLRPQTPYQD